MTKTPHDNAFGHRWRPWDTCDGEAPQTDALMPEGTE
jgi:hypothetical protein